MTPRRPIFRLAYLLEVVGLAALVFVLVRTGTSEFSRRSADALDHGLDPRLLLVDLVSQQLMAREKHNPHLVRFNMGKDGFVSGYQVAVKTDYGKPWSVLRTRKFPSTVKVTSTLSQLEFDADGKPSAGCQFDFREGKREWLVTIAERSGEMRLAEADAAVE